MKKYLYCLTGILLCGCGGLSANDHLNLTNQQPYVLAGSSTQTETGLSIDIEFSEAIAQDTVTSASAFVLTQDQYNSYSNWQDLADADSDLVKVTLSASWSNDSKQVLLSSPEILATGEQYAFVLLPKILSQSHLPLDQARAGSFKAEYFLSLSGQGDTSASSNANSGNSEEEANSEAAELPPFDWQRVLLSEIVVDPQADYGDSSGGNGNPFDSIPGNGTIGSTDEYIEIYNGSAETVNLTGWSLLMADGTDVTQSLDQATLFSLGGSISEFAPGEFLVIGNPDGDMKTEITVSLFDDTNTSIDSVTLEDANADDLTNEAWERAEDGWNWEAGESSVGF